MQRKCASCGGLYQATRPNSKFCKPACRVRAHRAPKAAKSKPVVPPVVVAGIAAAAARELGAAGRLDTWLGQAVLVLAARIESPMETGASIASMTKQLRETMVEALKGAHQVADPLDELRGRRDLKRAAG